MASPDTNSRCRDHSGVVTRLDHLEVNVKEHDGQLKDGQQKFADFSGDMRVIKLLLAALMFVLLGGTFGPKVWTILGF